MAREPFIPTVLFQPDRIPRGYVRTEKRGELLVEVHFQSRNATERVVRCAILHPHDLIAAIDVNNLARDRGGTVARQENSGVAEFRRITTSLKRRMFLVMF